MNSRISSVLATSWGNLPSLFLIQTSALARIKTFTISKQPATLDIGHFIPYLDTGLSNYTNYQIESEFNS